MKEAENDVGEIGEWFVIEPFSSITGRVSVVRGISPIARFLYPRHCTQHGFYVNGLARDFEEVLQRVKFVVTICQVCSLFS